MDISVTRLTDYQVAIATMEECWDEMCEDGATMPVPDLINEYWMSVVVDGKYAGFFRFAQITSIMYECHVCLLKGFRKHAKQIAVQTYKWLLSLNIEKLSANIPSFNSGALRYARIMGFKKQGENSNSFKKDGVLYSMIQLGITRKDMEDLCHL
jgi:RimJ/RimL family protein N-acetyltransferase